MKTLFCILVSALLLLSSGCKTDLTEAEKLATVQIIAEDAAMIGAAIDLQSNPDHRAGYSAAKIALDSLIKDGEFNATELMEVLQGLPQLNGSNGAIIIMGALSVWSAATGYIDLNSAPYVKAAMVGVRDGLKLVLESKQPLSKATAGIKQVTPPRR